jgi:hypothetical protein
LHQGNEGSVSVGFKVGGGGAQILLVKRNIALPPFREFSVYQRVKYINTVGNKVAGASWTSA